MKTCRARLEHTIEFDTAPQPCEYTFKFSTGTGLYLLDVINSLSRSLHLLRLNGKNISSSFALGVCVNMSAKFCVLGKVFFFLEKVFFFWKRFFLRENQFFYGQIH